MSKRYDKDFKIQTVELILRKVNQYLKCIENLAISEKTSYRCVNKYKEDPANAFRGSGNLKTEEVKKMCQVLAVSRSGYYACLKRPVSECDKKREQLKKMIY